MESFVCMDNEFLLEKIEIFRAFARKNQNIFLENSKFSEICLEKSIFLKPGSKTPTFQTRLTPLLTLPLPLFLLLISSSFFQSADQCILLVLAPMHARPSSLQSRSREALLSSGMWP